MKPIPKKTEQSHKHMRCVVCGLSFAATYDATTKKFRPFHIEPPKDDMPPCEDKAYEQLLYLLTYLHSLNNSVTITHLVFEYDWQPFMSKKKDFLQWCLETGYLTIDNFSRIEIPGKVAEEGEDLFETANLEREDKLKEAIEMLKQLLKRMVEEGGVEPVSPEDIPIKQGEIEQGPSMLYKNINTSEVDLKTDKPGMVTAGRTGAREVNKRMSTASNSMARKRLDQQS